jgi:alpha-beta hydrolase superfamily lysophospholipase
MMKTLRFWVSLNEALSESLTKWQKLGLFLVAGLQLVYLTTFFALRQWQNHLILQPTHTAEDITPARLHLTYEDVWLAWESAAGQGQKIHGWWLPGTSPQTETLLMLLGRKSDMGDHLTTVPRRSRLEFLHSLGISLLIIDYRGYGQSQGPFPTEQSLYEDAEKAWNYLVTTRKIPPQQIFMYGYSLGSAIAINLAIDHPEAGGVIVEGAFTSIQDLVDQSGRFWMFPSDWLITQKFDSFSKIQSLKIPILLIHGTADEIVPVTMTQTLFGAAPQPKEMILVSQADHETTPMLGGDYYIAGIRKFLQQSHKAF